MSVEKVLLAFAEENLSSDHYYPVSHGETTLIKPLAIVVKKRRSIFKRPFAKSEFKVIASLEDYVVKEKRQEFTQTVDSIILKEDNLEIREMQEEEAKEDERKEEEEEEEEGIGASSYVGVQLEAANCVKVNVQVADDLGELELGKLDQLYFKDPDLREVLAETTLDAKRMEGLKDQKLRLICSVIYSERFLLKGNRKHEVVVDAGAQALPEVADFLTKHVQLKAQYKKKIIPSKVASRITRGPVFFKLVRVDYDMENGRLKLCEGEFTGKSAMEYSRSGPSSEELLDITFEQIKEIRAEGECAGPAFLSDLWMADSEEYTETIVGMEEENNYLSEEDINKLETITEAVLKSEKSREKRKERVKKYLKWFEDGMIKDRLDNLKLTPVTRLVEEDRKFLRSICCPVGPKQKVVNLSSFDKEKIQGYAIVLKQIDDLSDGHWDEIEKAWAQPGQSQ